MQARLERRLGEVEVNFLNSEDVMAGDVSESDLASLFKRTEMLEEPGSVEEYIESFVSKAVANSVHCNSPSMIGHMTMSLPFFTRPLSKLVTAMHQ